MDPAQLDRIAARLATAKRLLFITGAGISAESGLPTYRGIGGLYADKHTSDGVSIETALSGPMFQVDPALTWRHLRDIEAACRGARPNRAHQIVAEIERSFTTVVLTQNVDGFHRAAGSTDVIDIHGDLHELLCTRCDWRARVADFSGLEPLPKCPTCGAVVRPDVVLFGELLPVRKVEKLHEELEGGFDAVFSVGTSSLFPYIVAPVRIVGRAGGLTVEINPGRTAISDAVDERLETGAVAGLEAIWSRLPQ